MQYYKELPNGNRVSVSEAEWLIDKHDKAYNQIIAAGTVLVYRLARCLGVTTEKPLQYGGRRKDGSSIHYGGI